MRPAIYLTLVLGLAALLGCGTPTPKRVSTAEWSGWLGDATIDPAGDLSKLQGKWRRNYNAPPGMHYPAAHVVFSGDTATFEPINLRAGDERAPRERVRFVLNSSVDPKVIRFTHSLGEGAATPLNRTHPEFNRMYSLDGDSLAIWTVWERAGERPKEIYERVKDK